MKTFVIKTYKKYKTKCIYKAFTDLTITMCKMEVRKLQLKLQKTRSKLSVIWPSKPSDKLNTNNYERITHITYLAHPKLHVKTFEGDNWLPSFTIDLEHLRNVHQEFNVLAHNSCFKCSQFLQNSHKAFCFWQGDILINYSNLQGGGRDTALATWPNPKQL